MKSTVLFAAAQRGFDMERAQRQQFSTAAELSMYLTGMHPVDVLDAEEVALYAGRLQAYLGGFLELRRPLDSEGREFDPEETARAEEAESKLAVNFATAWKNAVFLAKI